MTDIPTQMHYMAMALEAVRGGGLGRHAFRIAYEYRTVDVRGKHRTFRVNITPDPFDLFDIATREMAR